MALIRMNYSASEEYCKTKTEVPFIRHFAMSGDRATRDRLLLPSPLHAAVFAVSSIPSARITASVVFSVGFPFLLNDR